LISIITATYNSAKTINALIDSLHAQTEKDFEWVVADGESTDGTLEILQSLKDLDVKITSKKDFGIYDALNRALSICSGEYYLVLGSDDTLEPDAVENFSRAANETHADLIVFNILANKRLIQHNGKRSHLMRQRGFVAGHSVGTLIKKNLHIKFGFYSKKFPIAADYYFLERAYISGASIHYENIIAGSFGTGGVSTTDCLGALTESFRIRVELGGNKIVEMVVFVLRFIWNYRYL
jgi:glycosyltransferase involved in cell wall biosynthesis